MQMLPLDMMTPEEIQAAIITTMKNQPELISAVQDEIREDNWNGTAFTYPCYRVSVESVGPMTNGECRPFIFDVNFTVLCYAEGTSSKPSSYLAGLVAQNLQGRQIRTTSIVPVTRINIPESGITPAIPEGEREWRSDVRFNVQLKRNP